MASVLVVDDDPGNRELLARFLRRSGLSVHTAPNGRAALKHVLDQTPDVILLDVMMPEMDGVELMEVLRSYLRLSSLPVILVTAYPTGPHIERARELGMAALFEKASYHLDDLLDCIRKLVANPHGGCSAG